MLSAADLLHSLRRSPTARNGYSAADVDRFLSTVRATLATLESGHTSGPDGRRLLTPREVRDHHFSPVSAARAAAEGNSGEVYSAADVDRLVSEAAATLEEYVARARRGEPLVQPGDRREEAAADEQPTDSADPADSEALHGLDAAQRAEALALARPEAEQVTDQPEPPSGALSASELLRQLQYNRATLIGRSRDAVQLRTPNGRTLWALGVEKTPDGLVIRLG
ncbi:MAG: hypothetical protein ACTMIR_12990 [Cellulomonadaceae bacterium]